MQYTRTQMAKLFLYARQYCDKYRVRPVQEDVRQIDVTKANEVVASFFFTEDSLFKIETTKVFDIFAMFELGKFEQEAFGFVIYGYRS